MLGAHSLSHRNRRLTWVAPRWMHKEKQPHKWAIAWTTLCNTIPKTGGSFLLPEFGVRIIPAPNTLVAWIPRELHGTTLQDIDPFASLVDKVQMGAAIITPPRLEGAWRDYQAGLCSHNEALKQCGDHSDDDDGDGGGDGSSRDGRLEASTG